MTSQQILAGAVRRLAVPAPALLLVLLLGCNREAARLKEHEQLRAQHLDQEMLKLHADLSGWKPPESRGNKDWDRRVPDWKAHDEALARCRQLLEQAIAKMAAKQFSEVTPLSVEGIETARKLEALALDRRPEAERRAKASEKQNSLESLADAFVPAYYSYLQGAAVLYQHRFVQPLAVLSLDAPSAERLSVVERMASLYPGAKTPAASGELAQTLQKAWAEEDDPANKPQMEQKLKQLNLPLTAPAANQPSDAKSK